MRNTLRLGILLTLLATSVFADKITLKNGDRLTGTIVKSDNKTLVIKTEIAGLISVPWAAVEDVTTDQPLHVLSTDGQALIGNLTTKDGQFEVATQNVGTVTLAKDAVKILRSQEEQTTVERLAHPGLMKGWIGVVDTGLSMTRGNASTSTFTVGADALRVTSTDKSHAYFTLIKASNSTTGTARAVANARRGGLRYDRNLNNRTYAFGFTDLEFDQFQRLDLRTVVGGGVGRHVIKNDRTVLDVFGGASFNHENFSTGLRRNSAEVLFGNEFSHKLSGRMSFLQRAVMYPNVNNLGSYRFNFDSSLVTGLTKHLSWQITWSDRYLSNPPLPTLKKNDMLMTAGIRYTFNGNQ